MPTTRDDLTFAGTQQGMSDEEFLQATHRFGLATWHHFNAARFPGQTRYRLPTKW
jgi:hypothetical protein